MIRAAYDAYDTMCQVLCGIGKPGSATRAYDDAELVQTGQHVYDASLLFLPICQGGGVSAHTPLSLSLLLFLDLLVSYVKSLDHSTEYVLENTTDPSLCERYE